MRIGKKTGIFLIFFTLLSISLTVGAMWYTKTNWVDSSATVTIDENDNTSEEATSGTKIVSQTTTNVASAVELTDTYSMNALTIEENTYTEGVSTNTDYSEKLKITYPEILNLSDATVRTNINNSIKENTFNLYTAEDLTNTEVDYIEIVAKVTANYSDVLSIRIDTSFTYSNGNVEEDFYGLNYRLDSGDEISFKNLFVGGASIKSILRYSAYETYAWDYKNDKITDMSYVDYHDIEDKVFCALNDYSTTTDLEFCFTEREIIVKLNDTLISIEIMDCYEQIAIYEKYKSQTSLYASTSMANNIPVFTDRDEYATMDVYMVINQNLIIDVSLNVEGLDLTQNAINTAVSNYKQALNTSINALKENSNSDSDTYVYFISNITAKVDTEENKIIFLEDTYKYTAYSSTQFNVYITAPILTDKRDLIYSYKKTKYDLDDKNITIQDLENTVEYNLSTGSLYEEVIEEAQDGANSDSNEESTESSEEQNTNENVNTVQEGNVNETATEEDTTGQQEESSDGEFTTIITY